MWFMLVPLLLSTILMDLPGLRWRLRRLLLRGKVICRRSLVSLNHGSGIRCSSAQDAAYLQRRILQQSERVQGFAVVLSNIWRRRTMLYGLLESIELASGCFWSHFLDCVRHIDGSSPVPVIRTPFPKSSAPSRICDHAFKCNAFRLHR